MHSCIVKQSFLCLKIWSARHSKNHTRSNKPFYCFPLTFLYSYCSFIVKYTFQHKSYREYRRGWLNSCMWNPASIPEMYALPVRVRSQKHSPKIQASADTAARDSCIWSTRCYASIVTKPKQQGSMKVRLIPCRRLKVRYLVAQLPLLLVQSSFQANFISKTDRQQLFGNIC